MKINSKFTSLSAAVSASSVDLSYNESVAKREIAESDRNCREAFLMEDGSVYWVYEGGKYGRLLHKFTPFFGCISSAPLRPAIVDGDTIKFIDLPVSKSDLKARQAVTAAGMLLA